MESGTVFAGYTVVSRLGRGGMATVYHVRDVQLDRSVALKVLPEEVGEEAGFQERFTREARVIAALDHPNIIPLYAFGIERSVPWMALRYVDGGDLARRLEQGRISIEEGLAIMRPIAAALDFAHDHGVIHRDLKPQNVLLGAGGAVYLADFGIARVLENSSLYTSRTGSVMGTPQYMAPEQAQGLPLTAATDVYAFGVLCFQWLTGVLPFDAHTPMAVLWKHVQSPVPEELMTSLPPAVREALIGALEKDPARRIGRAGDLIRRLDRALHPGMVLPVSATATAIMPNPISGPHDAPFAPSGPHAPFPPAAGNASQDGGYWPNPDTGTQGHGEPLSAPFPAPSDSVREQARRSMPSPESLITGPQGYVQKRRPMSAAAAPRDGANLRRILLTLGLAAMLGAGVAVAFMLRSLLGSHPGDVAVASPSSAGAPSASPTPAVPTPTSAAPVAVDPKPDRPAVASTGSRLPPLATPTPSPAPATTATTSPPPLASPPSPATSPPVASANTPVAAPASPSPARPTSPPVTTPTPPPPPAPPPVATARPSPPSSTPAPASPAVVATTPAPAPAAVAAPAAPPPPTAALAPRTPVETRPATPEPPPAAPTAPAPATSPGALDPAMAATLPSDLRRAAEAGEMKAEAELGRRYAEGIGVARDDAQAAIWYRRAAEKGDATAQGQLGVLLQKGRGVGQDDAAAVEWYRKAASQGDAFAQCNLGYMYEYGRGVVKDPREAANWYRKAANQGYPRGQINLGFMYVEGTGVPRDREAAFNWFRKAAERGDPIGQFNLGLMYEGGNGVTQDLENAVKWYRKSAAQGDEDAKDALKRLRTR